MGIFESLVGGLERFAGSQFGEAAFGLAGQAIAARFAPPPVIVRGGPPVARLPVGPTLEGGQFIPAGGGGFVDTRTAEQFRQIAAEALGGGPPMPGVFQTTALGGGALQVPQPVPFGFDPSCPSFFRPSAMGARPIRLLMATNPATGKNTFWEHAGQPVLFTRDLAVCRRVRKIASKAGTVSRRRSRKR